MKNGLNTLNFYLQILPSNNASKDAQEIQNSVHTLGITLKWETTLISKNTGQLFLYEEFIYMKFQNSSLHDSKATEGTKSVTRKDVPKAICPSNFFKVWDIKNCIFSL